MSPNKPDNAYPICFHDGEFVPWDKAVLHTNCLAMRYALSVFDGIRLYKQQKTNALKPFALEEHVARIKRSLSLMRMPDPGISKINWIIEQLVRDNEILDDSYIRVSINAASFGNIGSPTTTSLSVCISRMGRKPWLTEWRNMKVSISRWQRASDSAFPSAAKNISNYAGPHLALLQAIAEGYDNTILVNSEGYLCEAPTAALFLVNGEKIMTPPLSEGVLPSITRQAILQICDALNIHAVEHRLRPGDAYLADEAFLCGTGLEIGPIASFDGYALEKVDESPITNRIMKAYFQLVRGEDILA